MDIQNIQFALIGFDKTNLLIPQVDVESIEMIDKVSDNNEDEHENEVIGQIKIDLESWPVFSLSADFTKLNKKRESDRYCICFKHPEQGLFGLICSTVTSFVYDNNDVIHAIPEMMQLAQSPIQKLLYYQNSLYLMSNAKQLYCSLVEVQ